MPVNAEQESKYSYYEPHAEGNTIVYDLNGGMSP